ncbi:MAG TPA: sigma-54-dependent Fis family transcriptional regulator [Spirochaetes bacterium]|nr:sigma-54-dependent Fis family transcriptional regulator [Spirochaetota bacterium]
MDKKDSIFVVDDDEAIVSFLTKLLEKNGYNVECSSSGDHAIKMLESNEYELVITDLLMDDFSGFDILRCTGKQDYAPEVIMITGHGSIHSAIEAIKQGAFDYITKPLEIKRMLLTVQQALERKRLKREISKLRDQIEGQEKGGIIIAVSKKMRKILEMVNMVSKIDSTVLIEGESGTGKELVARAIHYESAQSGNPFITVNCSALPEQLLESELFGHVKGAYTGAIKDKKGLFEEAEGGTILLDEIGDMPLQLQVKLLGVLQNREVRRVGSNITAPLNVRIIAATNRKLASLVKEGAFREDLYYRLNVIPIKIPPLRERKEDIESLLIHYLEIFKQKFKKDIKGFAPEALEILFEYDWPGNARELANFIERTVALGSSKTVTVSDVRNIFRLDGKQDQSQKVPDDLNLMDAVKRLEREYVLQSLKKNHWNQTRAARDLGVARASLWRKMQKHGLQAGAQ